MGAAIPTGGNHERENRISGFPSVPGHFSRNSAPHPGAGGHQHRSVRRPVLEAVRCAGRPHPGGGAAVLHAERVPDALAGGDAAVCSVLPQKPAQDWHSPGSVEPYLLRGESPDVRRDLPAAGLPRRSAQSGARIPHVVCLHPAGDLSPVPLFKENDRGLHRESAPSAGGNHFVSHCHSAHTQFGPAGVHPSVRPTDGGVSGLFPAGVLAGRPEADAQGTAAAVHPGRGGLSHRVSGKPEAGLAAVHPAAIQRRLPPAPLLYRGGGICPGPHFF